MATYVQQVFRFGNDDGTESAATFQAAQNTNINPTISANTNLTLRIAVANTAGVTATRGFQLQYSYNGGAYTNVTGSSSKVKGFSSSNLTDQGSTTNRLTGASGSFVAGGIGEAGNYDNSGDLFLLSAGKNSEFLYTLTLVNADLSNGDTLDFEISSLNTYTVVPRITISKASSSYTYNASGVLTGNGLSVNKTTGTFNAVGSLVGNGLQVNRTTGIFGAVGQLGTLQGLADSVTNFYVYSPSGGVGNIQSTRGGDPYVSGLFNSVGGKTGTATSPPNANNVQVSGKFNATGGALSPQSPNGGSPVVGGAFDGSGVLGNPAIGGGLGGDSGDDAIWVGHYYFPPSSDSTSDHFTPCCLLPDKASTLCCGCTSFTWDWWEITHVDKFKEATCVATDLHGTSYTYAITKGCALNNTSALRFLGPSPQIGVWSPPSNKCGWMSWPYVFETYGGGGDYFYGGHGNPPTSEFIGCCYLDLGGTQCQKRVGWTLSCQVATSATGTPGIDYTPAFPSAWYLSYFGSCGCNKTYIATTSAHPLYGFYQPTSGLDQTDACGNFYYQYWGALDATGEFDCTSGGRFVLMNFIQPVYLGGDCHSSQISPCNGGTNVYMGCDPVCAGACNGYNFTECHPGCVETGLYATVEPVTNMARLPHFGWTVNDANGNLLCCPTSGTSVQNLPADGTQQDIFRMALAQGNTLHFHYGVFAGLFVQVDVDRWKMNYPPLSFELVREGTTYLVNGHEATLLLDDPLMIEIKIDDELLEIHGD